MILLALNLGQQLVRFARKALAELGMSCVKIKVVPKYCFYPKIRGSHELEFRILYFPDNGLICVNSWYLGFPSFFFDFVSTTRDYYVLHELLAHGADLL